MTDNLQELGVLLAGTSREYRQGLRKIIGARFGYSPTLLCDHLCSLRTGAAGPDFDSRSYKQVVTDIADKVGIDWGSTVGAGSWFELSAEQIEAAIVRHVDGDKIYVEDKQPQLPDTIAALDDAFSSLGPEWRKLLAAVIYINQVIRVPSNGTAPVGEIPVAEAAPKLEPEPKIEPAPELEAEPKLEALPELEAPPKAEAPPKLEASPTVETSPKVDAPPKAKPVTDKRRGGENTKAAALESQPAPEPGRKTGDEPLRSKSRVLGPTLLDFWRWSMSDLLENATLELLAEYIVSRALGLAKDLRRPAGASDIVLSPSGLKIEVEAAADLPASAEPKLPESRFSIRAPRLAEGSTSFLAVDLKRRADVYVFCLLNQRGSKTLDPLDLSQWEFYVVKSSVLDEKFPLGRTIPLRSLRGLEIPAIKYEELSACIQQQVPAAPVRRW